MNIDARADGANGYNGDQSFWYEPFNTSGSLLTYTVSAGVYGFRVVNPTDAAQLFPTLTTAQTNEIYTAWTFNSPWIEDYMVFGSAAANNNSISQIFDGAYTNVYGGGPFYPDAASAYNAVIQNGSYDEIRTGGRDSTIFTNSYTFATATNLIFVVADYGLSDNAGGVSVVVSKIGNLGSESPPLSISCSGNTVTVSWKSGTGWSLYQCANLASPTNWSPVSGVTTANGTNYLQFISPARNLFFRLEQ
ncbi:MAG TPA: hypothetical protein VGV18_01440 [Verrucomicrobiae bacterium]|nr:hypothetical protein [Verrucomicrobiae bacterium]